MTTLGFDFTTTYRPGQVRHAVNFFQPCKMKATIIEETRRNFAGEEYVATTIVYQRGSVHGRRYETALSFEDARERVTRWVRRNEKLMGLRA